MASALKIGISSCLLGQKVRYNGGHKQDRYLTDVLGKYVSWVPVCPEAECGLGIPREAMRLTGDPAHPRLVTSRSGRDLTVRMEKWCREKLQVLENEDLDGYVFKSKSPSSGMRDVKIYSEKGYPVHKGIGIFARAFITRFPLVPVEDEGRLHDPGFKENFIEKIFAFRRFKDMLRDGPRPSGLTMFHARNKLQLMAHGPAPAKELGALAATARKGNYDTVCSRYLALMLKTLGLRATERKQVNVLQHAAGYFKKQLTGPEKRELTDVFETYRRGEVPLIVPVSLLKHYIMKYDQEYLAGQCYFAYHPSEMMLRNHV